MLRNTEEVGWDAVHRVLQERYRPWATVEGLARCFAEVAARVTHVEWARVELDDPWGGQAPTVGEYREDGRSPAPKATSGRGGIEIPVRYQTRDLGRLRLPASAREGSAGLVARTIAHHRMRLRVARLARQLFGRDAAVIGPSQVLGEVDRLLEGASRSELPVMLVGPAGSEVERLGLALHLLGPRAARPFVEVHCGTIDSPDRERRWAELVERADGGTLLLAHLASLQPSEQSRLLQFLETGRVSGGGKRGGPRLMTSAGDDVDRLVAAGALDAELLATLEAFRVDLPPLRRRREDIPALVAHFLRRDGVGGDRATISDEALAACMDHDWPGDRLELSHAVARLVLLAGPAGRVDLDHVRELARAGGVAGGRSALSSRTQGVPGEAAALRILAASRDLHPSLRRAVRHVVHDEGGALTLSEVANAAHVSKSHLAHLLKRELGTTFTLLLSDLRVARAKDLLLDDPWMPISTVAERAGFTHVRQLERTFKRVEGCTPSTFRDRVRRHAELRGTWLGFRDP